MVRRIVVVPLHGYLIGNRGRLLNSEPVTSGGDPERLVLMCLSGLVANARLSSRSGIHGTHHEVGIGVELAREAGPSPSRPWVASEMTLSHAPAPLYISTDTTSIEVASHRMMVAVRLPVSSLNR